MQSKSKFFVYVLIVSFLNVPGAICYHLLESWMRAAIQSILNSILNQQGELYEYASQ